MSWVEVLDGSSKKFCLEIPGEILRRTLQTNIEMNCQRSFLGIHLNNTHKHFWWFIFKNFKMNLQWTNDRNAFAQNLAELVSNLFKNSSNACTFSVTAIDFSCKLKCKYEKVSNYWALSSGHAVIRWTNNKSREINLLWIIDSWINAG